MTTEEILKQIAGDAKAALGKPPASQFGSLLRILGLAEKGRREYEHEEKS